jgi:DNA-directed RNA polymerase subunit RPC12/RpoP
MSDTTHPPPRMVCFLCRKIFRNSDSFYNHARKHNNNYSCSRCNQVFNSAYKLEIHVNRKHRCQYCDFQCTEPDILNEHKFTCHEHRLRLGTTQYGGRKRIYSPYPFREVKAFDGYLHTYRQRVKRFEKPVNSVSDYFRLYGSKLNEILNHCVLEHHSIKFQATLVCEFIRKDENDRIMETVLHYVNSNMKVVLNEFYVRKVYSEIVS